MADDQQRALAEYRRKLLEHKELEARVKARREELLKLTKAYDKTEDDLRALQSIGQTIGEVLKQLDEDRFIVKASNGPRFVVGYRKKVGHKTPPLSRGGVIHFSAILVFFPCRSIAVHSNRASVSRLT
jgi:ATP-dependent 26S proteasome regulatory subunit